MNIRFYTLFFAIIALFPAVAVSVDDCKILAVAKPSPLWTGNKDFRGSDYRVRTIDEVGVPEWDDSISDPKLTDFSDEFIESGIDYDSFEYYDDNEPRVIKSKYTQISQPELQPVGSEISDVPEITISNTGSENNRGVSMINIYVDQRDLSIMNGADVDTESEIEKLLAPHKPKNHWSDDSVELGLMPVPQNLCPFETEPECAIWVRKPHVKETVANRRGTINSQNFDAIIRAGNNISADDKIAAPLVSRYKALQAAARVCCTDGITYELKAAGATDGLVYKFLMDDANFYQFGDRCLMITDEEFDNKYTNVATANVVADVRNGCLCRRREWFKSLLKPFDDIYKQAPEFQDAEFIYNYTDGLQREISTSINSDVINVLNQLDKCP